MTDTQEVETDVARLVCLLADSMTQASVFCEDGPTEGHLQQFRDALNKLIDERVALAMGGVRRKACQHEWRDPRIEETPCSSDSPPVFKVCSLCGAQKTPPTSHTFSRSTT